MPEPAAPPTSTTANPAKEIFNSVEAPIQELIKAILSAEREVQHFSKKHGIHVNILNIIKDTVK
jgi:hypothetical protein